MSLYESRNPAAAAVGQLGLLTTVLAAGSMSCHERGLQAMRATRERRVQDDLADALDRADAENAELAALARQALAEVSRLREENRTLRQAVADRQRVLDRHRNRPCAANAA